MGLRRLLVLASAAAVLAVVGLLVAGGGVQGGREQAATQPPMQQYQPLDIDQVSIRLSPGDSILAAGFSRGVFIFVNESPRGGALLNVVDLESLEVAWSIVIGGALPDPPEFRILGYDGSRVYYDVTGLLYMAELGGGRVVGGQLPTRDLVAVEGGVAYYFNRSAVGAFSVETGEPLWIHELELYYPPEVAGGTLRGAIPVPIGAWVVDGSLVVLARESIPLDTGGFQEFYWLVRADEAGAEAYYIYGYRLIAEFAQHGPMAGLHDGVIYVLEWARYSKPEGGVEGFAQLRVISLEGGSSIVFRDVFTDDSWPDEVYVDMVIGDGWIGVGYYSGLGRVSFYRLAEGGEPELIANLGLLGVKILGFTEDAIYYVNLTDYNVYLVDDQGRARIIGSIPRGDLGELIALPIIAPILPFTGQATSAAYIEGSTVYVYYRGILIKMEAES